MYTLHLDFKVQYTPPMPEHGPSITFTRAIQLPFPPHEGLILHSADMDQCPKPGGFFLKDVVWDIDRQVFLATASLHDGSTPVGAIIEQIQDWLDRGWTLGSYHDTYSDISTRPKGQRKRRRGAKVDWDELESMQENRLPRRPASFMREFHAWIRFLADNFAEYAAYAMDRAGTVEPPTQYTRDGRECPEWNAWQILLREYGKLSEADQSKWLRKVKRYPKWTSLLD